MSRSVARSVIIVGSGSFGLSRGPTQRKSARSPHLSLAAVVPTLIEVQDSEERLARVRAQRRVRAVVQESLQGLQVQG